MHFCILRGLHASEGTVCFIIVLTMARREILALTLGAHPRRFFSTDIGASTLFFSKMSRLPPLTRRKAVASTPSTSSRSRGAEELILSRFCVRESLITLLLLARWPCHHGVGGGCRHSTDAIWWLSSCRVPCHVGKEKAPPLSLCSGEVT